MSFLAGTEAPEIVERAYWFVYSGNRVLLEKTDEELRAPLLDSVDELGLDLVRTHFIGMWGDLPVFSAETLTKTAPSGYEFLALRATYDTVTEDTFFIAGRAFQIIEWDRTHQFCGRCATPMEGHPKEHLKICPNCKNRNYPRISPAVIVAVTRGDRLLLAHNRNHPDGWYTVLAGFVEAGETFEETVAREIREEVGIEVKNIRYFGSQPWAFPNSLMIGFTAEWAGGEFIFEDVDIETADWFSAENMPPRPHPPSIAAHLIDDFIERQTRED